MRAEYEGRTKDAAIDRIDTNDENQLLLAILEGETSCEAKPFDMAAFIAAKLKSSSNKAGFPPSRE